MSDELAKISSVARIIRFGREANIMLMAGPFEAGGLRHCCFYYCTFNYQMMANLMV